MRYLSSALLAAQRANSGTPYITMSPGIGASVLFRHPSVTAAVGDIKALAFDEQNPTQFFAAGYTSTEGAGNKDGWLGKMKASDLDKVAGVVYGDANINRFNDMVIDEDYIYCSGVGTSTALLIKYNKSDLSKSAAVKWGTATQSDGVAQYGNYVYLVSYTGEGAATSSGYLAELNKSDLSINADYYSEDAAGDGGYPNSWYEGVICDGTTVFACGKESDDTPTTKAIVDKFDVAGLGNGAAKVITQGTAITLYRMAYDETHLYLVGWDDAATDIGILIKLLKSDLSVVAAASFTSSDGACRLMNIVSDGDHIYICGYSYSDTNSDNAGILIKVNKSDLSIDTQMSFVDNDGPQDTQFWSITQDGNHIYTAVDETGSGIRTLVKWNKNLLTTGTTSNYIVEAGNVTKATITPTIANSTRVLAASGDSVSASNLTAAASTFDVDSLLTIGASVPASYNNSDRILRVVQTETPYGDEAEIILNNSDQVLSDDDWRGVLITLGFGFGTEASYVPDLYVAFQEDISIAGVLFTRLVCIGNWGKLEMHKVMGDSIDGALTTGTDTIQEIIEARILSNMSLVIDTSDGTEATKVPQAIYPVYTDRRVIIQECNGLTGNLLFMRGSDIHMIEKNNSQQHRITGTLSGTFIQGETVTQATSAATGKFVYQTTTYIVVEAETGTFSSTYTCTGGVSGATVTTPSAYDAFDYLYGPLAGDHTFYSLKRTQSILTANRVIAVDVLPDTSGTLHNFPTSATYYAEDTTDQATFGITTLIFEDASISSDAESQAAAEARLLHIQQESVGGVMVAPMNCGAEMYDYVQIDDDRAGWTSGSELPLRVSKIVRRYQPGMYTIELGFGGLDWDIPANFDMTTLIDAAIAGVGRGPEGVVERPPRQEPPTPPIPEGIPFMGPGGRETAPEAPVVTQGLVTPQANLPGQRITGFLGGRMTREQSEISLGGVRRRLVREKQEADRKKELAKELAAKAWANVTKGLRF